MIRKTHTDISVLGKCLKRANTCSIKGSKKQKDGQIIHFVSKIEVIHQRRQDKGGVV